MLTTQDHAISFLKGKYNSATKKGYALENAKINYGKQVVLGDSIYFDDSRKFASITNNVRIIDTINQMIILGHYAQLEKQKKQVVITKKPLAVYYTEKDSLYVSADTLKIKGDKDKRTITGFARVHLFNTDQISSVCDSITISEETGIIKMLKKPTVWNTATQIIGDTIQISQNKITKKIDSIFVQNNAFVAKKDTIGDGFNQVKGDFLTALLTNNALDSIHVNQHTETLFYQREKDLSLTGITKISADNAKVVFQEKEIKDIFYYNDITGAFLKPKDLSKPKRLLKGFVNRFDKQITSRKQLVQADTITLDLPKITGIPLPEQQEDFLSKEMLDELIDFIKIKDTDIPQNVEAFSKESKFVRRPKKM